ncbi:MAG: type II toxin-antitoxin system VapC family toxin [Planctomycetes bacterium]|nr:type II toxin-antitoxin system VapC family toxin [Planctomycetota bacterium]MBL7037737.1 type II toxin-antitoxin system VapC family toxin [Pirellulaceae bacterium]
MDTVYIETSIVSHASARPSSNPATAVLQVQAKRWLTQEAQKYDLVTSQFVIDEVSRGDPDAATERLELLENVRVLVPDAAVEQIADEIIRRSLMPGNARLDALHVASAAVGGVEYLLTQNCRHIANATVLPRVYDLLEELGLPRLLICTPAEFPGDPDNGS